ncbi:MAG: hypothetical protein J0H99_21610 [Rhodospirillales bacterium]|nr:hypothetical protein [Rhodospirillales bacterium]
MLDRAAYEWILRRTTPEDLFATPLPAAADSLGPTVGTVFAAGRRLVAPPAVHSNPYLPWPPQEARRRAALTGTPDALCALHRAAAPGADAWLLLPRGHTPLLPPTFETAHHLLVRVPPESCASGER